jgi:hypothetical protein
MPVISLSCNHFLEEQLHYTLYVIIKHKNKFIKEVCKKLLSFKSCKFRKFNFS